MHTTPTILLLVKMMSINITKKQVTGQQRSCLALLGSIMQLQLALAVGGVAVTHHRLLVYPCGLLLCVQVVRAVVCVEVMLITGLAGSLCSGWLAGEACGDLNMASISCWGRTVCWSLQ